VNLVVKKVSPPLIRVEKNFFKIVRKGYQNKRNFALISKMCRSLEFSKGEKNFIEKLISEKKILNFLTQESYTFIKSAQDSASFDTLCAEFAFFLS
jgi:hypothetical protein